MGILDSIMTPVSQADDPLAEREKWLQMSQLFNSFTMNPNASQGYYDSQQRGIDRKRESIALRSGNELAAAKLENDTKRALQLLGEFPDIADAVRGGFLSPNAGVTEARKLKAAGTKERRIVKGPDDFNYYADDQSRVLPNALAPDAKGTAQMQNYNFWIDRGKTPEQAEALVKSGQTFIIGGENQTAGRKKVDEVYAADYLQWTQGGGADMTGQLAQIGSVLGQLESGQSLTGPVIGMLGSYSPMALSIINPEAANAKEQVEEVVQRNLRIVLGAQFTEKEGERLISRAYNPTLPPKQNAARLRKLFLQMGTAAKQRDAMASYFGEKGTLIGYEGEQPSINDFYSALSSFSVGQVVSGYKFMGGDPTQKKNWSEQ